MNKQTLKLGLREKWRQYTTNPHSQFIKPREINWNFNLISKYKVALAYRLLNCVGK